MPKCPSSEGRDSGPSPIAVIGKSLSPDGKTGLSATTCYSPEAALLPAPKKGISVRTFISPLAVAAGTIVSALVLGASSPAQAMPKAATRTKTPNPVLLVLSARDGMIAKTGKDYTLTLSGVDKHTLWFADRPDRAAGFVKTSRVVSEWSLGLQPSPPNAGLVHAGIRMRRKNRPQPESVELLKPTQQANGDLVFPIKALAGDRITTGRFSQPVLFIDSVNPCIDLAPPEC